MGSYRNIYKWVSSLLGGSRTDAQVRHFVNKDLLTHGGQYSRALSSVGAPEKDCSDPDIDSE